MPIIPGGVHTVRIAIVACDILKGELEYLTSDDEDFVHREYLEFALHEYPQDMKAKIVETVNALEGQVDAVLLGYAVCQSLEGVTSELKVPTVMLRGVDCIDALLGPCEYAREKGICIGTWFCSPGWAEQGTQGLVKQFHLDSVEGYDPAFFFDMLFQSYQRCLFIDDGIGNEGYFRSKAGEFSDEIGLRLDERICDLRYIESAVAKVKALARGEPMPDDPEPAVAEESPEPKDDW